MKNLKNWDNKTWLASERYIKSFCTFVKTKKKLNKNTKILDIGCGRANIMSRLQKTFKFKTKPTGIDVVRHRDVKKNIRFIKCDAIKFLKKGEKFDLIIIKQVIHLLSKKDRIILLNLCRSSLVNKGRLLIFSLKTKGNQIPVFKSFKEKLEISLKKDDKIFTIIKKMIKKIDIIFFNFKVNLKKTNYIKMIKNRYISCLLKMTDKQINEGAEEINIRYKNQIKFNDSLICITFTK